MIPIGQSFLFVEPIYLQADTSRLPELVRVVVANGNAIAMEQTFDRALDVVLGRAQSSLPGGSDAGGTTPDATPTPTPAPGSETPSGDVDQLLEDARDAVDEVEADLDRLRALLDALERAQAESSN